MHRHAHGTTCSATGDAPTVAGHRTLASWLLDLGALATFAVAMLALAAMSDPAPAGSAAPDPAAGRQIVADRA